MRRVSHFTAALLIPAMVLGTAASSQSPLGLAPPVAPRDDANVNRGRFIAMGGLFGDQRIGCIQCHGLDGVGNTSGAFPRLADQAGWYLYKTLQDYASGSRSNEIMSPIARTLTPAQMQDVAAYYASIRNAPFPPSPDVDVRVLQIGGALAAVGAPTQGVPSCNSCHGPRGIGNAPVYPALGGQYAPYLEHQLLEWKAGRRGGDPMNVMQTIARAMTDEQIRAVSVYYAAVRPHEWTPRDRPLTDTEAARSSAGGTARSDVGAVRQPEPGRGMTVVPGAGPMEGAHPSGAGAAQTRTLPPYLLPNASMPRPGQAPAMPQ